MDIKEEGWEGSWSQQHQHTWEPSPPHSARDPCTTVSPFLFPRCQDFNTPKWYLTAKEMVSIIQWRLLHQVPPTTNRVAVPEQDTMLFWTSKVPALASGINPQGLTHPLGEVLPGTVCMCFEGLQCRHGHSLAVSTLCVVRGCFHMDRASLTLFVPSTA